MKQKLIDLITTNKNYAKVLTAPKTPEMTALREWVDTFTGETFAEKVYVATHDNCEGKCKNCAKPVEFFNTQRGYPKFCSVPCRYEFEKKENHAAGIEKINAFANGNFTYISGEARPHEFVVVRNNTCGCEFRIVCKNLYTNENYCSKCGTAARVQNMKERFSKGC